MNNIYLSDLELKKANKSIKKLSKKLDDKVLKKVIRQSTKPLINSARSTVSKRTGNLSKSIGNLPLRKAKRSVYVGPKSGKKRKYDGWYGRFVEFGTKHMKPRPFMGPSWDKSKGSVLRNIELKLKRIIKI